jgi:inhibitor of cysteine peptidase
MLARPVAVAALTLLSLAGSGVLAQERSETRQSATIGVPFEIALPSNPSTGYQWRIDTSASSNLQNVRIDDLGTSSPPSGGRQPLIGAPVTQRWVTTPLGVGSVRLVLTYSRSWESVPPAKTHTFLIDVTDGGSQKR